MNRISAAAIAVMVALGCGAPVQEEDRDHLWDDYDGGEALEEFIAEQDAKREAQGRIPVAEVMRQFDEFGYYEPPDVGPEFKSVTLSDFDSSYVPGHGFPAVINDLGGPRRLRADYVPGQQRPYMPHIMDGDNGRCNGAETVCIVPPNKRFDVNACIPDHFTDDSRIIMLLSLLELQDLLAPSGWRLRVVEKIGLGFCFDDDRHQASFAYSDAMTGDWRVRPPGITLPIGDKYDHACDDALGCIQLTVPTNIDLQPFSSTGDKRGLVRSGSGFILPQVATWDRARIRISTRNLTQESDRFKLTRAQKLDYLYDVVTHEAGHMLGLEHLRPSSSTGRRPSVMQPNVRGVSELTVPGRGAFDPFQLNFLKGYRFNP